MLRLTAQTRESLIAIVLLSAGSVASFWPLFLRPTDIIVGVQDDGRNDLTTYFLANRSFPKQCWERYGQLPLWNHLSGFGSPFVGNPQSALFYPPNWIFWFIDASSGMSWLLLAHHIGAGVGSYSLARRLGVSFVGSVVGGLSFQCAPYLIAQTGEGHAAQICVMAWIPWCLHAAERLMSGETGVWRPMAILMALSFFAGHVQECFYVVLVVTGCVIARAICLVWGGQSPAAIQMFLCWASACIAMVGMVAVDLLPTYIASTHTVRSGGFESSATAGAIGIGISSFRQLLDPFALGGPEQYIGPGKYFWETLFHFGRLPLMLALVAVVFSWKRVSVPRLVVLVALTVAIAFGSGSPIYEAAFRLIPHFSAFRSPGRALFFTTLFVAMLAAFGIDRITGWVYRVVPSAWGRRQRVVSGVGVIFLLVIVAEQAQFASRVLRTIPSSSVEVGSTLSSLGHQSEPFRVLADQELLPDREAWALGIQKTQVYEPTLLWRSVAFVDAMTGDLDATAEAAGFVAPKLGAYRISLLNLSNVRYFVGQQAPPVDMNWTFKDRGIRNEVVAIRGSELRRLSYLVYENTHFLPRAFVVGETRTGRDALESIAILEQLDPQREIMLARDVLPTGQRQSFRPATIIEYSPNRVVIDADLDRPGYLFLGDSWSPGWRAEVDGELAAVLPANLAFRGVALRAGHHRVVMEFMPPGLVIGSIVSCLAVVFVASRGRRVPPRMHSATANEL